ncbi:hypothetical protein N7481_007370 [Penicillium waksmanii]|uniref:uncharacterized protein n=1 Tax=Penicillium waksmanii TaxID=69791 RepID=UPI002548920E|nr:uncharacterized protein N7481_007370 [Penicillium waksmanii]KAJ5980072.1 hypothetical protein N7481_007370 [Penicillium waksmanii]
MAQTALIIDQGVEASIRFNLSRRNESASATEVFKLFEWFVSELDVSVSLEYIQISSVSTVEGAETSRIDHFVATRPLLTLIGLRDS